MLKLLSEHCGTLRFPGVTKLQYSISRIYSIYGRKRKQAAYGTPGLQIHCCLSFLLFFNFFFSFLFISFSFFLSFSLSRTIYIFYIYIYTHTHIYIYLYLLYIYIYIYIYIQDYLASNQVNSGRSHIQNRRSSGVPMNGPAALPFFSILARPMSFTCLNCQVPVCSFHICHSSRPCSVGLT